MQCSYCFLLALLLFLFLEGIAGRFRYSFELSLTRTVGLRWLVPRPRAGGVIVVVLLVLDFSCLSNSLSTSAWNRGRVASGVVNRKELGNIWTCFFPAPLRQLSQIPIER
jgi:hypothetical protein